MTLVKTTATIDKSHSQEVWFRNSAGLFVRSTTLVDENDDQIGIASSPLYTRDLFLEIQKGNIPGHSAVHKFGRNPDIDSAVGTFEAIWNGGGDYTGQDPIAAETLETFSGSANDAGTVLSSGTATGGSSTTLIDTGADFVTDTVAVNDVVINDTDQSHGIVTVVTGLNTLTVERFNGVVPYVGGVFESGDSYRVVTPASTGAAVIKLGFLLDANWAETTEYIVLNGVTAVDTSGTYLRHSKARVVKCGSNNSNVGELTTRQKTTTANITMVLPVGYNSTMIACYTIPAGKTGYIVHVFTELSSTKSSTHSVRLLYRMVNEVFTVEEEGSLIAAGSTGKQRPFQIPKNDLSEKTDIKLMADSDTNDAGVAGGFDIILVDN